MLKKIVHMGQLLLVLVLVVCSPLKAQDFLATFLSAEFAVDEYRYDVAEGFIEQLPEEAFENPEILQLALKTYVGIGNIDRANEFADRLLAMENDFILARVINIVELLHRYEYDAVRTSLAENPLNFPLTTLFQGWASYGEGSIDSALAIFQEGLGQDAGFLNNWAGSLIHASTGNYQTALDTLGEVSNYPPALQNEVLHLRVGLLLKQGQLAQAREEFDLLIMSDIDPRKVPFLLLGEYLDTGDATGLDLTITAQQGMARLLSAVARIATNNNDASGDSLALFRLASYLDPADVTLTFSASRTLLFLDSYELALQSLAEILPGNPYFQASSALQADIYYDKGEVEKSLQIVEKALEFHPTSVDLWYLDGEIQYNDLNYDDALVSIDRALELARADDRDGWDIYFLRGSIYYFLNNWEMAEIDWRMALDLSPDNALILNNLGYTLADRNIKLDEAEELIRRAVEAEPENGYYVDSLGWVLFRRGKFEEALEYLKRADRLTPNEPEVIDHIADAYWILGEEALAIREWERALENEPYEVLAKKIEYKLMYGLEEGIKRFEEEQ